jgi:hypothetical protein
MAGIEKGDEQDGADRGSPPNINVQEVLELGDVPMKYLALLALFLFLSAPMLAAAQTLPVEPVPPAWAVVINRDEGVYWIGEEIAGAINGTANTTVSIELRPFYNNTVQNATYQAYTRTNANGTCTFIIAKVDEPGDYRLQILVNQMVVAYQDVRFDYDEARWNEIMHERNEYHDWQQDCALTNKTLATNAVWSYIHKFEKYLAIIILFNVAICIAELPQWVNRYAAYKKRGSKGSFMVRLVSRSEDRTLIYGGAKVGDEDPKISDKEITWRPKPYATKLDGKEVMVDIKTDIWDLSGKTTDEVLKQIKVNADKLGVKLPPRVAQPDTRTWLEKRKAAKLAKREALWNDKLMDAIEECVERSVETGKEVV